MVDHGPRRGNLGGGSSQDAFRRTMIVPEDDDIEAE